MVDASTLGAQVTAYFRANGARYGLRAERTEARYVLNWGGFVNSSFTVTDGTRAYHLKLAGDEVHATRLRRWQALHRLLEERYRAPELVDWVALPGSSMQGALFRHLAGAPPDFERTPELLPAVLALCGRLHGDGDLRAALGGLGPPAPRSLADAFCDTYIARFDEDLAAVAAERPPFVTDAVLSWMERETRRLERMVREAAAFAGPAVSPVHGDLQANNLLLTGSGEWYVLDWDDLDLGDPALDYTVLLWPRLRMQPAGVWRDHPLPGAADAALSARMTLYLRAKLLDDVIDVLADWVEATTVPERLTEIREQKRGEHEWARALYRQWYGV